MLKPESQASYLVERETVQHAQLPEIISFSCAFVNSFSGVNSHDCPTYSAHAACQRVEWTRTDRELLLGSIAVRINITFVHFFIVSKDVSLTPLYRTVINVQRLIALPAKVWCLQDSQIINRP